MKEYIKKTFFDLNDLVGISGYEQDVARYCRDRLVPYADKVEVMQNGNVIGTFDSGKPGHNIMLLAHMDEVGICVKYITPNGFILFEKIGGLSLKTLPGRRIRLKGDKGFVTGLIGIKPGHLTPPAEANTVPSTIQSFIDIGALSRAEAEEMGIHVGTTGTYDCPAIELNKADLITGRCVDDRIGCAVLLELAKELKGLNFTGRVHLVFAVHEEDSHYGAISASDYLKPDYTITLDTFPAGGTPDVPESAVSANIGKGPVLSLYEAMILGFIAYQPHVGLLKHAKKVASEKNIPIQYVTMAEAFYCNDASDILKTGSHCACLEIGLPRRYSHSPAELFSLEDAESTLQLLAGFLDTNQSVNLDFIQD